MHQPGIVEHLPPFIHRVNGQLPLPGLNLLMAEVIWQRVGSIDNQHFFRLALLAYKQFLVVGRQAVVSDVRRYRVHLRPRADTDRLEAGLTLGGTIEHPQTLGRSLELLIVTCGYRHFPKALCQPLPAYLQ